MRPSNAARWPVWPSVRAGWLACWLFAAMGLEASWAADNSAGAPQSAGALQASGTVVVKSGSRTVAVYQAVENPAKPYVAVLCSPGGVNVLRDSPADHKHHHGVMFAVAANGIDFWSETAKCGRQVHRGGPLDENSPQDGQRVVIGPQRIEWVGPGDGKPLLQETRRIAIQPAAPSAAFTLLVWESELRTAAGDPVTLTGAPYFGLGMRFVASMDVGGSFVNAEGKTGVSGTNNVRSAWCAYSASADGKPVTVAMFDAPTNVRHPATWFTMDQGFAYLSATLDLSRQPLEIQPGKALKLRYGVAVWDGKVGPEPIAAAYRSFVEQP